MCNCEFTNRISFFKISVFLPLYVIKHALRMIASHQNITIHHVLIVPGNLIKSQPGSVKSEETNHSLLTSKLFKKKRGRMNLFPSSRTDITA
jgi:hypothetical protein